MRIQAFDEEFNMLEDRLLVQLPELLAGPKETHKGPLKIEVCLFNHHDVDRFVEYLHRLQGNLPLREKGERKIKKQKQEKSSPNEVFIDNLKMVTEASEFNTLLKDYGFVYSTRQLVEDLNLPVAYPKDVDLEDYRLLIRLVKKSKNPLNHKYDCSLIILVEKHGDGIIAVLLGESVVIKSVENLNKQSVKVPKSMDTVFPHFMTLEERNKFRVEKAKLVENPDKAPSNFYRRWVHYVAGENQGRGIMFPKIDQIERPY